jgi:hypothetical protein
MRGGPDFPAPEMSAVYVYALQDRPGRRRVLLGHVIEIMRVDRIYAAVERRSAAPRMSEASLRTQHQIVVRLGKVADAILPVRFGALVDAEALQRVVHRRQAVLAKSFEQVRGREQMTVRIFGPAPRQSAAVSLKARSGTEYLAGRRASRDTLPPAAALISRAVRGLASAEQIDGARGGMQAALNHLVSRGCATEYRMLVRDAVASLSRVSVTISGPWPPFAFVPDLWASD